MSGSNIKTDKIEWSGRIVAVQPHIRLMRSSDERHHSYQDFVLRMDGTCAGESGEFIIAIGKAAHQKHQFRVGMEVCGLSNPFPDPRMEMSGFYKTSGLNIMKKVENGSPPGPHGGERP